MLLAVLGLTLLSTTLQARFAYAASGFGNAGNRMASGLSISGMSGQFLVGLLLGAIWSPCVGPTLGAASVMAAQGKDLGSVALVMVAFAVGTTLPLLLVGSLSRITLRRWQGRIMGAGKAGKQLLGATVMVVAVLILTGADHSLEASLVAASPPWLTPAHHAVLTALRRLRLKKTIKEGYAMTIRTPRLAAALLLAAPVLLAGPARAADHMNADQVRAAVAAAPAGKVDLSSQDMSGDDLTGLDLSGANLVKANLAGANLHGVKLVGANLTDADLAKADLTFDLVHQGAV